MLDDNALDSRNQCGLVVSWLSRLVVPEEVACFGIKVI
jgi:hypothetical protein